MTNEELLRCDIQRAERDKAEHNYEQFIAAAIFAATVLIGIALAL